LQYQLQEIHLVDTVEITFVHSAKAALTKKAIGPEVACGHSEVPESEGLRSDLVVVRSIAKDDVPVCGFLVHLERLLLRHTGRQGQFGLFCSNNRNKSGTWRAPFIDPFPFPKPNCERKRRFWIRMVGWPQNPKFWGGGRKNRNETNYGTSRAAQQRGPLWEEEEEEEDDLT
jgi:hypothetical protein